MIQGYVYIIESELGIYKIGRTKNVDARISQLKSLPFKIELVHTITCEDDQQFEQGLHDRFKDKRKTGEWFNLTKDDIEQLKTIKYVKAATQELDIIRLSKEQQYNLFEILQKYAAQK